MKLLINDARHEILTSPESIQQQLHNIEIAGRNCYQSYKGEITPESTKKFISMIMNRGHLSVIEHGLITVKFFNVSRGFQVEIVRHRIASFSIESTRYVDYAKCNSTNNTESSDIDLDKFSIKVIGPAHRDVHQKVELADGRKLSFADMAQQTEDFYRALRKNGWNPEDARQILPNGLNSDIVISANFREWRHIFKMRTDKAAHWEIRFAMCKLLEDLKPLLSPILDDFELVGQDSNGYDYYEPKLKCF